jgi:hypothetical protein
MVDKHCCPDKIYIVPNGTFIVLYQILYQYIVPNGTVPEGRDVCRIKMNPLNLRSPVGTICIKHFSVFFLF